MRKEMDQERSPVKRSEIWIVIERAIRREGRSLVLLLLGMIDRLIGVVKN